MKLPHDTSAGTERTQENPSAAVTATVTRANPEATSALEAPAILVPDEHAFFFPHKLREPSVRGLSGRPIYVQLQGSNQPRPVRPRSVMPPNWDHPRFHGPTPARGWLGLLLGLVGRSH